ncbi:MAG: hypothetical protein QNK23_12140 [Crocinitomicaceae bacterium]|nr:hypothetical protein [Crocinitomicaceae bacterium]
MRVFILLLAVGLVGFTSCKKCKGEDPTARVLNNGTESVSVHLETSGGNTVNINNIDAGQSSDFASYAAGTVSYTITVGNGGTSTNYYATVAMEECFQYDIILNANNVITTVPTDLNE